MTATVARFVRDCAGATLVEYAIIGSLVSVALAFAATAIGTQLNSVFGSIAPHFNSGE